MLVCVDAGRRTWSSPTPVQAGVMTVMAIADTAKFTVARLQRRVF